MTRSPSPSNPSEQLQESGSDQSNTERRTFTEAVPSTERRTFSEAPPRPTSSRSEGRGGSSRGGGGGMLGAFQDDELLEYAEQQAREEEEEDEDDPLDAFMANIETQIKKQVEKKKVEEEQPEDNKQQKGQRCDIDADDDQESYFKAMEENPNFVSPEEDDDMEVEYDDDGNPIYTPKKKIIIPLDPIDHSEIVYPAFGKDFYKEHADIETLNALEVVELRNKLGLKVSGFNPPKPVSSFAHFGFDSHTMATIRKQEYTKPTPIQAQAIPAGISGRDVIGIARTGSGKTAAYVWPMIPHIMDQEELGPGDGPIAIVLAPTRELCIQIHQECRKFTKAFKLRVVCAYGGGNMYEQEKALTSQCEIVVATPGRLIDHIKRKKLSMTRVTYLVLDECDRMFDLGFEPQVNSIVQRCRPDRQVLLFSATMRNKITRLCRQILESPIHIQEQHGAGSANQDVTQITHTHSSQEDKFRWLQTRLVEFTSTGSVLVFVTRKINSEELAGKLRRCDYELGLLHGDMSQYERNDIITSFKKQEFRVLVATDVAARGLDIKEIKTVVNYDVARDIDTHTHRVGRTGRAGEKGTAYTLLTRSDMQFAGDLVKHLEMACQEVPKDVLGLAMMDPNFKKGRGNLRKGFGRSDEKLRPGLGGPGLGAGSTASQAPSLAIEGPMSARQKFGGMNALGGSGTRANELKTAMKSNYMSRFAKASDTIAKTFQPENKAFTKPSSSLYAGFTKASPGPPKPAVPLVTPPVNASFKTPPPPGPSPKNFLQSMGPPSTPSMPPPGAPSMPPPNTPSMPPPDSSNMVSQTNSPKVKKSRWN